MVLFSCRFALFWVPSLHESSVFCTDGANSVANYHFLLLKSSGSKMISSSEVTFPSSIVIFQRYCV